MALRTAQAYFCANPDLHFALLVASDRAQDLGRVCLPISIMADAASAIVVARAGRRPQRIGLIRAVMTQQSGRFVDVIGTERESSAVRVGNTNGGMNVCRRTVCAARLNCCCVNASWIDGGRDVDGLGNGEDGRIGRKSRKWTNLRITQSAKETWVRCPLPSGAART